MQRTACVVIGCRRTCAASWGHSEWVCGKHWAAVSKQYRAELSSVRRKLRRSPSYREYWKLPPGSPERVRLVDLWQAHNVAWKTCMQQAMERAMGIG